MMFYINRYDYGARFYDPAIGRFFTIDPRIEDFYFQGPFVYASNNPIIYIDYNGEGPWDIVKGVGLMVGGAVQVVGGGIMACAPTGITQIAGGALMTNGIVNIGWGGAVIANNGKEDLAGGPVQAVGKEIDYYTGNENHTMEKIGAVSDFGLGLFGGAAIGSKVVSTIDFGATMIDGISTIETFNELNEDGSSNEAAELLDNSVEFDFGTTNPFEMQDDLFPQDNAALPNFKIEEELYE